MKTLRPFIVAAAILGSMLTAAFAAESFSVLLQRGIFAEETEGNLDAAITIYQQITAEAAAQRAIAAQAQYRLGVCLQKKGDKEQAISALNGLLRQFPAEAALGQKAQEALASLGQLPPGQLLRYQFPSNWSWSMPISPDGRLFAFSPKSETSADGYEHRADMYEFATGKTWTAVLWTNPDDQMWLSFSPDSRKIAYALSSSFYIAKVDGSDAKPIHDLKGQGRARKVNEWSQDGRSLLVSWFDQDKNTNIGVLDVATGNLRELKRWADLTLRPRYASISPQGRFVAYMPGPKDRKDSKINLIEVESGAETTLVAEEVEQGLFGWSLASDELLFFSSRTGAKGLWAIAVRDDKPVGEPYLVAPNVGDVSEPLAFTRDGSFYYIGSAPRQNVYLATANLETGEILSRPSLATVRFQGAQSHPVWSKDGQTLLMSIQGEQRRYIEVSLAEGTKQEFQIANINGTNNYNSCAWSHDGKFVFAVARTRMGTSGIHRCELATGSTELIVMTRNSTVPGDWNGHPRLAPDGKSLYYTRRDFFKGTGEKMDWKDSIMRRDLQSGREKVVYSSPERLQIMWPYELSPNGDRLAIVASDEFRTEDFVVALKVHDVNGAETGEVLRLAPRENLTSLAWTPDGKRLVFSKDLPAKTSGVDRVTEVWSTAVDSKQSVKLALPLQQVFAINIHPDGRQIAFGSGSRLTRGIWAMPGLLGKPARQTVRAANY